MNDKNQLLTQLNEVFHRWDDLVSHLSAEQRLASLPSTTWSTKDVLAHLLVWQQRSSARLQAALLDGDPDFSRWPEHLDPDADDDRDLDAFNAWIYETYRLQPWESVYGEWRSGFLRFLELAQAVPESDLLAVDKYPWLPGYALSAVLLGSLEHHLEHLDMLQV